MLSMSLTILQLQENKVCNSAHILYTYMHTHSKCPISHTEVYIEKNNNKSMSETLNPWLAFVL